MVIKYKMSIIKGGVSYMLLIIVSMLLTVLFLAFLFLGLVLCRKNSFKEGFYFFLILIVHKISTYFYIPLLNTFTDSIVTGRYSLPMGMTIGEFVSWWTLFPIIINLFAFGILIFGLYKLWRNKINLEY